VITDLTMPGMIRIELAERVHARGHEARLILIGNFASSVGVEPLRVIGFVEALQKPMKMSALAHAVDRVLAVRG
jgi:DNA-binding NtrC family response regulator